MKEIKYTPVLGMETHIELKTLSKMFCECVNDPFNAEKPNTFTCPVCIGFPGALVVPNKKAVEWTIRVALALNCKINRESKFDRKHYSYTDLPKGYQISQYDKPIGYDGYLEIKDGDSFRKIRIRRVHLEEDTGKLIHKQVNGEGLSLVDFNRSGVPLVEIVTEPDFRSASEAKEFSKRLQKIIRYIEVSDADMEKGSMRLEANISISPDDVITDKNLPPYKVELKNINSFRFMVQAVEYEIKRQKEILSRNEKVSQETRGWDEAKKETRLQRSKEDAQEYRYFPEPDIPPMRFSEAMIKDIKASMPLLPDYYTVVFNNFGISKETVDTLTEKRVNAEKIVGILKIVENKKMFINWFLHRRSDVENFENEEIIKLFTKESSKDEVSITQMKNWISEVISENSDVIKEYLAGKEKALMYLVGRVQNKSKGRTEASNVINLLKQMLLKK